MTETPMTNSSKKRRNAAKCLECGTVIESKHRRDLVTCACGAIFLDTDSVGSFRFGCTPGKRFELL
jgi:hypothetical protein